MFSENADDLTRECQVDLPMQVAVVQEGRVVGHLSPEPSRDNGVHVDMRNFVLFRELAKSVAVRRRDADRKAVRRSRLAEVRQRGGELAARVVQFAQLVEKIGKVAEAVELFEQGQGAFQVLVDVLGAVGLLEQAQGLGFPARGAPVEGARGRKQVVALGNDQDQEDVFGRGVPDHVLHAAFVPDQAVLALVRRDNVVAEELPLVALVFGHDLTREHAAQQQIAGSQARERGQGGRGRGHVRGVVARRFVLARVQDENVRFVPGSLEVVVHRRFRGPVGTRVVVHLDGGTAVTLLQEERGHRQKIEPAARFAVHDVGVRRPVGRGPAQHGEPDRGGPGRRVEVAFARNVPRLTGLEAA